MEFQRTAAVPVRYLFRTYTCTVGWNEQNEIITLISVKRKDRPYQAKNNTAWNVYMRSLSDADIRRAILLQLFGDDKTLIARATNSLVQDRLERASFWTAFILWVFGFVFLGYLYHRYSRSETISALIEVAAFLYFIAALDPIQAYVREKVARYFLLDTYGES